MNGIGIETKRRMIDKAKSLYGNITPCSKHDDFYKSFIVYDGTIMFWFNDETNNTKVVQEVINETSND